MYSDQPDIYSSDSGPVEADDLKRLDESEGLKDRGKILFTASMGFFTDAYDLFIIVAGALITFMLPEPSQ